jgi:hypothetical protein
MHTHRSVIDTCEVTNVALTLFVLGRLLVTR